MVAQDGAVRAGRGAAKALTGVVVLLTVAALLATGLTFAITGDRAVHPEFFVPDLVLGVTYGLFGAVIAPRTGHRAGWALAGVGLGFLVTAAAIQWNLLAFDRGLPGASVSASVVVSGWFVGVLIAFLVLPWLLAPRPATQWERMAATAGLVVAALGGGVKFVAGVPGSMSGPAVSPEVSDAATRLDGWLIPVYVLLALPGGIHLIRRRAHAADHERTALGWVLSSVLILAVSYLLFEAGLAVGGAPLAAAAATVFIAQVMVLAATFSMVQRDESWAVDLAISRSIVAALLVATVIAIYTFVVWLVSRTLPFGDDTAGLVAVLLVALGVTPLRTWVQHRVDDLVFGSGARATRMLDDLGRELGPSSGDDLLGNLAAGLRRGLRLRRVEIAAVPPGLRAVAGSSDRVDLLVPLQRGDVVVGSVSLTAPRGQRLDPRTVRVVTQLSGLVAICLELAGANQQLELARRRLLEARQEERRLIRRELHDGLGPSLSGVTLALAAIANTSSLRPEDAALLGQICDELNRRAGDVRQMARVLLPPALEVGRLEQALGDLAVRFTDDTFAVTVAVDGADLLPEQHQVAAYHIVAEGVRNAHRHAGARRCIVRLGAGADGSVVLEVEDDGTGVDPGAAPGVGLSSMRERAAELGGTFDLVSGDGGSRVRVRLP